jgi:hypothetical protein
MPSWTLHFCLFSKGKLFMKRIPAWMGMLAIFVLAYSSWAEQGGSEGYALTVYNQDLVLVRDRRHLSVNEGTHLLRFEDIAATLDPTSVNIVSLTDPAAFKVLEQNYEYDLVNQQKLLQKYIGQDITLLNFGAVGNQKGEDLKVKLLSSDGNQLVAQKSDGSLLSVYSSQNLLFPKLPDGLLLKPTLTWKVKSTSSGKPLLNVAYLASGMGWRADYTFSVNDDENQADVNGWVTINNQTGTSFPDARLKLLAGDVNRVAVNAPRPMMMKAVRAVAEDASGATFEEKTFSEYHLYTLQRTASLRNDETKQIELLSASKVPVKKIYRYDGAGTGGWIGEGYSDPSYGAASGNTKVDVVLEIENSEKAGLGMPLPAGKIRIYKRDDDGSQEFLGEDSVDHTPKDETVRVKMGTAFDVKGERKQTSFVNSHNNTIEETFEITLKNHKKQDVTVRVLERLYRYSNWKITESSVPFEKQDSRTVEFPVKVPADGKTVLTYTVKYWWK